VRSAQASAQAGEGAKMGAVGGVVAGAVGALLWGGNPLEGAVKGVLGGAAALVLCWVSFAAFRTGLGGDLPNLRFFSTKYGYK